MIEWKFNPAYARLTARSLAAVNRTDAWATAVLVDEFDAAGF